MYKHVGRIKNNQRKVVVAYRTIPNDPYSCLVVTSDALPASDHDDLMKLVESDAGQSADEFYEAMQRTYLSDGRNMLAGLHAHGHMRKFPTNEVEMVPNRSSTILLSELNEVIAQQKGVAIDDLAVKGETKEPAPAAQESTPATLEAPQDEVLTDEAIAAKLRSDADRLFKEAKALREQAEDLSPTKRKTTKKTTESAQWVADKNNSTNETDWDDIFEDIEIEILPIDYMNKCIIKFKDGTVWEVDIKDSRKKQSADDIEQSLETLFQEYEPTIDNIDFRMDMERIKKDLTKRVKRFLKLNK